MKQIVKSTGIVLGVLMSLALLVCVVLYFIGMEKLNRSYDDIQVEAVNIPSESDAVARGRHIAVVWECTKCHGADLSGMLLADDPFVGTIPASNLTFGKGGIVGSYTDADWIRAIRHGVKPNGRGEILMHDYYSTMSDRDLGDLIAFLKQIAPVDSDYPSMHIGPLFAIATAVGLFTPAAELIDHGAPRPVDPPRGITKEYGRYLSVLCTHCHSENFGGKLGKWTQDDFVRAVRTGVLPDGKKMGKAMSLPSYGEMNDIELAAVWLYLQNLQSVRAQK